MAELQEHEIKIEEQTVKRVMNCPFAWGLDKRWGDQIVDERTCGSCSFHDWRRGCVYGEANLPTVRTAVFDEESKAPWFVWRFKCYHCQHPVTIVSLYENMSSGYHGHCHGCGAFHYFIRWECNHCPENEKWWYAVTKPDPGSIKNVNERVANREYQARIPSRLQRKKD